MSNLDRPYVGPNGNERPDEHWNARLLREDAERKRAVAAIERVRELCDNWDPPKRLEGDRLMAQFDSGYCNALVDVRRLLDGTS